MNKPMISMCSIIFAVLALLASFSFAAGGSSSAGGPGPQHRDISNEILNHPIVLKIEKLLNEKYSDHCVLPAGPQDIKWMCMGAILPVTQPTIRSNGCGFSVSIDCQGEKTVLWGSTISYSLINPPTQPSSVTPTTELVLIENVETK